jgi:hypothetical protein
MGLVPRDDDDLDRLLTLERGLGAKGVEGGDHVEAARLEPAGQRVEDSTIPVDDQGGKTTRRCHLR